MAEEAQRCLALCCHFASLPRPSGNLCALVADSVESDSGPALKLTLTATGKQVTECTPLLDEKPSVQNNRRSCASQDDAGRYVHPNHIFYA